MFYYAHPFGFWGFRISTTSCARVEPFYVAAVRVNNLLLIQYDRIRTFVSRRIHPESIGVYFGRGKGGNYIFDGVLGGVVRKLQ